MQWEFHGQIINMFTNTSTLNQIRQTEDGVALHRLLQTVAPHGLNVPQDYETHDTEGTFLPLREWHKVIEFSIIAL